MQSETCDCKTLKTVRTFPAFQSRDSFYILCSYVGVSYLLFVSSRYAVAQLVEALCYKSEGRGFDSQWVSLEFFIEIILPAALWPWGLLAL